MMLIELFTASVSNAFTAAEMISDPHQKAVAYAEVAKAIAMSGLLTQSSYDTDEQVGKEAIVEKQSGPEGTEATIVGGEYGVAETTVENAVEEELTEEWTEAAQERFANEIEFVNKLSSSLGEDFINNVVAEFSDGVATDVSFVNPLNIEAFSLHVYNLLMQHVAEIEQQVGSEALTEFLQQFSDGVVADVKELDPISLVDFVVALNTQEA